MVQVCARHEVSVNGSGPLEHAVTRWLQRRTSRPRPGLSPPRQRGAPLPPTVRPAPAGGGRRRVVSSGRGGGALRGGASHSSAAPPVRERSGTSPAGSTTSCPRPVTTTDETSSQNASVRAGRRTGSADRRGGARGAGDGKGGP